MFDTAWGTILRAILCCEQWLEGDIKTYKKGKWRRSCSIGTAAQLQGSAIILQTLVIII